MATRAYALLTTDDYGLIGEIMAQYSTVFTFTVDPVVPTPDMSAAMLRGAEWAAA